MSLVLEALRRIDRPDARPGSIGVAVASYRPRRKGGRSMKPLLMGVVAGAVGVAALELSTSRSRSAISENSRFDRAPDQADQPAKGAAALPPMVVLAAPGVTGSTHVDIARPPERGAVEGAAQSPPKSETLAATAPEALVLQAISERDARPIAIISDQLVHEGDLLGRTRIVRIGTESVEVLLGNGRREVIRFAPPPEHTPSPEIR